MVLVVTIFVIKVAVVVFVIVDGIVDELVIVVTILFVCV